MIKAQLFLTFFFLKINGQHPYTPYENLELLILSWMSKLLIRNTHQREFNSSCTFRSVGLMAALSTGHVGCLVSHSFIQAEQNACSHWGACRGSSSTQLHIVHINSSSTSPSNRFTSNPILQSCRGLIGSSQTRGRGGERCALGDCETNNRHGAAQHGVSLYFWI